MFKSLEENNQTLMQTGRRGKRKRKPEMPRVDCKMCYTYLDGEFRETSTEVTGCEVRQGKRFT